eukprot:574912-Prymnesium_polylepis.1
MSASPAGSCFATSARRQVQLGRQPRRHCRRRRRQRQRLRAVALRRGHVCSAPDELVPPVPARPCLVAARPRSSPRRPAPSPYYHGVYDGGRWPMVAPGGGVGRYAAL